MRADRLVSLVLLLRGRGRMSATALARELEVSTRTVLRDVEALSAAGVPVYAERGRRGGFALLPGYRAELTGLNHDEALALLVTGSGGGSFGLGGALAAALRKVADALPAPNRDTAHDAASRLLASPATDLLSRPLAADGAPGAVLAEVRRAVVAGRRLRLRYAAPGGEPGWRVVDPIGLVGAGDRTYLLATRDGEDRTYRLSRVLAAEALPEPAVRAAEVDLERVWRERCARLIPESAQVTVVARVDPARREEVAGTAVAVRSTGPETTGWPGLEVLYQDRRHAEWALWQLAEAVEVLSPPWLREHLRARATTLVDRYATPPDRDSPAPQAPSPDALTPRKTSP
ncbi:WYL domain-containing protein [Actinosynnema pretiosum subsp. pretiosum]|uniref:WYL domain-containing protein n=1 Tax=Actinosynnema pretiosum subsp. pretiosum TaxID=103721 RepID=A0AA45L7H6_9PSEU|nr:Transcriptional regulator, DeoR family [Actinosynnema pretiosum subsp. pretiosum]QUF05034.1 WYL domain-containing protein [Actinosynnema pretiosum subsp. pretiosum]